MPDPRSRSSPHTSRRDDLDLTFTTDTSAYADADFVVVATPTNYDPETDAFDTATVEQVDPRGPRGAPTATIVVKSTVPVGFVEDVRERLGTDQVIFSPEFLREGQALHDNLHPTRIIVGEKSDRARSSPTCWPRRHSSPTYPCC